MEPQVAVLVPSKGKKFFLLTDTERKLLNADELVTWLEGANGAPVLGPMGGSGQSYFSLATQLGKDVHRIPWFRLEISTGVTAGASVEERAEGILQAWLGEPNLFYRFELPDTDTLMVRELTRVRLNIQEYRKMAWLQYLASWRDLSPLLPQETLKTGEAAAIAGAKRKNPKAKKVEPDYGSEEFIAFLEGLPRDLRKWMELRVRFANPEMIQGAYADEKELEKRIVPLVEKFPIWQWLHPEKDSVLPRVLGLGPSLGGSLIGEIGSIRQFAGPGNLRAYARMHVNPEGQFPRRKHGEVSAWNRYLNRAVWFWSTDQAPRYDHVWRDLYLYRKAKELQAHPEPVARKVVDRRNRERTVWDYTLKHCDSRAKRWVGLKFLNYVFDVWSAGESGRNPGLWYPTSHWPDFFKQVEYELDEDGGDLAAYLEAEIPKRRRREPEEEVEEEL